MQAREDRHTYTVADYMDWPEGERCELIDGVIYDMSPPSTAHQRVLRNLLRQFANYLEGKTCEVFPARFGVFLNDFNVVEPDLTILCDGKKITEKGCEGTPDMIIEILSPSNKRHDNMRKFNLYLGAGVREYWIVDPADQSVSVHLLVSLGKQEYITREYSSEDKVPVTILENLSIDMTRVFPQEAAETVQPET